MTGLWTNLDFLLESFHVFYANEIGESVEQHHAVEDVVEDASHVRVARVVIAAYQDQGHAAWGQGQQREVKQAAAVQRSRATGKAAIATAGVKG